MKNINRLGEIEYSDESGFEKGMENATRSIIWPSLIAAALLGLFCATGLVIGIVKFINWVMM